MLAATAAIYWPGLPGGFYFDDFAQLVLNPFVQIEAPSSGALLKAAASSTSGPTGRPLSMVSFALDYWRLGGLTPAGFKQINLFLHLINGLLVAWLTSQLLRALGAPSPAARQATWLAAAFWLLNPLHVSTVLYTVQRMTLLSSGFMIAGLLGYVAARQRGRWAWALASLGLGTGLATFSKENGLLAPAYAAIIEVFVLRFAGLPAGARRAYLLLYGVGAVFLAATVAVLVADPDWAARSYAGRSFSLSERLLTQLRVLAFYQRQALLPDLNAMGLYHDDYPLSKGLWHPPSTAVALAWHLLLLATSALLRRRAPLAGLGLAWFYVSHLLESTIWPLELVFEHRN
ncbi:MAG: hypothetical protein ACK4FK_18770, partial [Ferrovibrio sp.]|uniref:hypothetical protein n=1 Tax=Ferrovibrio sp. TaxID=1917215 RepID=UPI00391D733E